MRRKGETRTGIKQAVDDGEVRRDENQDGLHGEHLERAEQRAVDEALERPVLVFVLREHVLASLRIGLAHFLDLLQQDYWCVCLGEGGEHNQSADARKYEHDPEDPSPRRAALKNA